MTTPTETLFETAADLTDASRAGLNHLLTASADTKLLLGYHYGEWTFGTPELEAAVASCSLAQSELGHVRLLHAILKKHYEQDPDALVETRTPGEFANVAFLDRDLSGWADFVAMNYVVDMAVTRIIHAMRGSAFKPIRMSVEKMLDEERYHVHHGQGWFRSAAARGHAQRQAIETSVNTALTSVAEWYGPEDEPGDRALVEDGIKQRTNPELFQALVADIRAAADPAGVSITVPAPDFAGWNPATRRSTPGGPTDDMLYHLRGSKNEVFKVK